MNGDHAAGASAIDADRDPPRNAGAVNRTTGATVPPPVPLPPVEELRPIKFRHLSNTDPWNRGISSAVKAKVQNDSPLLVTVRVTFRVRINALAVNLDASAMDTSAPGDQPPSKETTRTMRGDRSTC